MFRVKSCLNIHPAQRPKTHVCIQSCFLAKLSHFKPKPDSVFEGPPRQKSRFLPRDAESADLSRTEFSMSPDHLRPSKKITCPKSTVYTSTNNHLGWELGGDWGFRGGDRGQGTYTWRCSTMNQQPFRLGTGGDWGFRGGDRDSGLIHGDVLQ